MRRRDPDNPSLETIRVSLAQTDKFEKKVALLGKRYAIQTVRPIGSLHCEFRRKLDTDSSRSWTVIPRQAGQ